MILTIDKDVPIPAHSQNVGYGETIAAMVKGDSVFFPLGDEKRAKGFARAMRDRGLAVKVAKVVEDEGQRRGTRVWHEGAKSA